MLLGSGSRFFNHARGRQVGAGTAGAQLLGWDKQGRRNNRVMAWGGQWALGKSAVPAGRTHPSSWLMPISSGSIASRITGEFDLVGNGVMGLAAEGEITGEFTMSGNGGLVASAIGAITGDLSMNASIVAIAEAAGQISGELTMAASIGALAGLTGAISGEATLSATPFAVGTMSGEIGATVEAELSPSAVAAAVWEYSDQGTSSDTMGRRQVDAATIEQVRIEIEAAD